MRAARIITVLYNVQYYKGFKFDSLVGKTTALRGSDLQIDTEIFIPMILELI